MDINPTALATMMEKEKQKMPVYLQNGQMGLSAWRGGPSQ